MMKSIRTAAKPIYIIVAIAFIGTIIFAWGMDLTGQGQGNRPANAVGKINDQEISIQTFSQTYKNKYDEFIQTNNDPTEEDLQRLRDETWNSIVGQVLMAQQIEKYDVKVTPEELTEYVKAMPPQELYGVEDFQTDGRFDPAKYQNYLQNLAASPEPQAEQILLYIESTVKSQILINKLQEMVVSTAYVSKDEVLEQYRARNEKVKVRYAYISNNNIDTSNIEITDQMLQERYAQDKENLYKSQETATLRYVSFPKEPGQADLDSVKSDIDKIYQEIKDGADFAELAIAHSQDGSGKDGGDLGWFGRNRMVKPFEDAAFGLKKIGDVSEPIKSRFGWHIIKLTGKRDKNEKGEKEEQVKASHILLKTEMSAQTLADIKANAERFRQEAIADGFDEAAKLSEYEIQSTTPFNRGSSIREFGNNAELNKLAFDGKEGAISNTVDIRNAIVVATRGLYNPEGYKPFDDVKSSIESAIKREILNERAYSRGQDLYQTMISSNLSLNQLAQQNNLDVKETDLFTRNDYVKNIGSDADFIGAAFTLSPEHRLSQPVKSRNGCYLIEFIDHQPMDMVEYEAVSDSLFRDVSTKKRQDVWREWYRSVYDNSTIEDYRDEIYGS